MGGIMVWEISTPQTKQTTTTLRMMAFPTIDPYHKWNWQNLKWNQTSRGPQKRK